ncbi:MAG: DUF885 domain-containing protein [Oscillospiraceae bacterium]|nr:DUF885 domain-containing protein [Oscillospiraceae bacterium]
MKKFSQKLLSSLLALLIITPYGTSLVRAESAQEVRAAFDEFLNQIFISSMSSDSITLNYNLRHPENFGIERIEPTLGNYSIAPYAEYRKEYENYYENLKSFSYSLLNEEQRLIYDILEYNIKLELELMSEDIYYYPATLRPSGFQSVLPVILAEYRLYDENDVKDYLTLLTKINDYFEQIYKHEQKRASLGLFMSDSTLDAVVKEINEFTAKKENNFLIETFNARLDELKITSSKKAEYKEENKKRVLNNVIPAYNNLASNLKKMKGQGKNNGGLSGFKHGKEYYEYLVKAYTGSDKSAEELAALIDERTEQLLYAVLLIAMIEPSVLEYIDEPGYSSDDPKKILETLKSKITDYYPPAAKVQHEVKYVPPSLEDSLSPAFYLTPPIDDYSQNVIYINRSSVKSNTLFNTLAHEGYPGHLYQITYFNSKDVNPLRKIMSFSGYTEGWATYAEIDSFKFADFPEINDELTAILRINSDFSLAIHSRIDIGVNYEGWSVNDTQEYLSKFGIDSKDTAKGIYDYVVQSPARFLQYYVGYLEFEELRAYTAEKLGDKFSLKDFHKCVLDTGPAPFPIVKKELDKYISSVLRAQPPQSPQRQSSQIRPFYYRAVA